MHWEEYICKYLINLKPKKQIVMTLEDTDVQN